MTMNDNTSSSAEIRPLEGRFHIRKVSPSKLLYLYKSHNGSGTFGGLRQRFLYTGLVLAFAALTTSAQAQDNEPNECIAFFEGAFFQKMPDWLEDGTYGSHSDAFQEALIGSTCTPEIMTQNQQT